MKFLLGFLFLAQLGAANHVDDYKFSDPSVNFAVRGTKSHQTPVVLVHLSGEKGDVDFSLTKRDLKYLEGVLGR